MVRQIRAGSGSSLTALFEEALREAVLRRQLGVVIMAIERPLKEMLPWKSWRECRLRRPRLQPEFSTVLST